MNSRQGHFVIVLCFHIHSGFVPPDFAVHELRSRDVGEPSATFRPAVRRLRSAFGVQFLDNDLPTCLSVRPILPQNYSL